MKSVTVFTVICVVATVVGAFDRDDGFVITNSYSVPIQHALKRNEVADKTEFELLHRMKTMNPPSEDSVHYYAVKSIERPNRFRTRRSPQGLKFEGSDKKQNDVKSGDDNKRFFGGFHDPYYGQGFYGGGAGGHHPYYPNAGFGHGGYPGYGGGAYGGGYPHNGFNNGVSSATASASASGGNIGGGGYRPGFGGGLYNPGYYPGGNYGNYGGGAGYPGYPGAAGAYPPTSYPILGPGGFGGPGFYRDENGKGATGKVSAAAVSSGGKTTGGVSFD